MFRTLLILGSLLFVFPLFAEETLTPPAIFVRCYSQLTQLRPAPNHPLLLKVISGQLGPVDACMQVFDKARFTTKNNTAIANAQDQEALAVLNNLHRLHASWFRNREFVAIFAAGQFRSLQDVYDTESPAFFFDRALFGAGVEYQSVVTDDKVYRAVRTNPDPEVGFMTQSPKANFVFGAGFRLAPTGQLLGVEAMPVSSFRTSFTINKNTGATAQGEVSLGRNFGGGIIGSAPYLMLTVNEPSDFAANGAEKMPRKWAKSVFNDLLCRSLPVVRQADAARFVVKNGNVAPFRKDNNCTICHASMDRMASGIRNFRYASIGLNQADERGGNFAKFFSATMGAHPEWDATSQPTHIPPRFGDVYQRNEEDTPPQGAYNFTEPDGVLYFRDHMGNLVNENFRGVGDLGNRLATRKDLYLCAAKRYYAYFMGVDVPLEDGSNKVTLTGADQIHRANINMLANQLMSGTAAANNTDKQNLRMMVKRLLQLPQYRSSSFGTER